MNPWNYVAACFAIALGGTALLLFNSWRAVKRAEADARNWSKGE